MLQDVGFLTKREKQEAENGTVHDLEIKLPFHIKEKFYVMEHKTKTSEGQPDFSIYDNSCKVGSIWKPKEGRKAMTGEIFSLGISAFTDTKTNAEKPFQRFLIIEKENLKKEMKQFVSISYGADDYTGQTQEEQPDPFK